MAQPGENTVKVIVKCREVCLHAYKGLFVVEQPVFIMMRRLFQSKEFKGSVFVEFSTVDEAKNVLATEDLKYKDQELSKMFKYVFSIDIFSFSSIHSFFLEPCLFSFSSC